MNKLLLEKKVNIN